VFAGTRIFLSGVSLLLAGALVAPAPAAAQPETARATTTLCVGYTGCAQLGMGDGGYRAQSGTMWWRMYSGHNCVNYAAYRMIKAGLPNVRPWTGSGNATNWGPANPKIRDSVPTVGAIAWWSAYHPPAGASGHVAYVEKVVSDSEIIVSQDSWGGDFSWARITRTSGRWPTGFLHFKDAAVLTNTAAPTVSGTPRVASTLTATGASWTPAGANVTYQWRADGANIPNATSSTLVLGLGQLGKQISVVATAQSPGVPSSSVESARTAPVEAGQLASSVAPSIVGEPRVDSTLTASPGSWTPTPTTLTYRWFANGRRIPAATTPTLTPGPQFLGKNLAVRVIARLEGYDAVRTRVRTTPVAPGTFTVIEPPAVTGTPLPGETLSLDPGSYAPATADELSIAWLRDGLPVAGATSMTYPLTAADLGASLTAQVTVARPGYEPLATQAVATEPVKALPSLHVQVVRGTNRVRLTVTVTAGEELATGDVAAVRGGRVLDQSTLRGGTASVLLPELRTGVRTIWVRYSGSDTVLGTMLKRGVRFP
jgi:surface antigen